MLCLLGVKNSADGRQVEFARRNLVHHASGTQPLASTVVPLCLEDVAEAPDAVLEGIQHRRIDREHLQIGRDEYATSGREPEHQDDENS